VFQVRGLEMNDEPKITKMQFPDEKGGLTLAAKHPAFAVLASECMRLFRESGGINYCEWTMESADPDFGQFTVTIQRKKGKTQAEVSTELRKKNEELLLLIAEIDVDHHLLRGGKERLEGHKKCKLCSKIEGVYGMGGSHGPQ